MSRSSIIYFIFLITFISGCIRNNDIKTKNPQGSAITQEQYVSPRLNEILFVGAIGKKSGLYKYNFLEKNYSEFWKSSNEEIVELSYSPDKKSAFLVTAYQQGKKGVFPFINSIKLYNINLDSNSINFITNIGSGLHVFSCWENDNSFKVYLNVIDVTVAKYVEQRIKTFDSSGKMLSDEKKVFNLDKDGYPPSPQIIKKLTSPNNRVSIKAVDSTNTQIYLVNHKKNDELTLITTVNQKLNFINWSENEKLLIFSTIDITPNNETLYNSEPKTAQLFVYSLENKKITKRFEGSGIKNFMLNRSILIFDNGFESKSQILLYDIDSEQIIDSIKISGGCGLKCIPVIPNYGA